MTEKIQDRQRLANTIIQWNQDHYDLFELSQPNEDCEFHGVVRFYFQDGSNVVTKCIRVASTATTKEVVDVLVEKFRPDMRMLTANKYALYEVHANGEERRLENNEKVLWVQLNWGTDVREGRFLLKREGDTTLAHARGSIPVDKENQGGTFKRKLSKREKKEQKKKEKEKKIAADVGSAAEQLYTDMPETRFTRSISNPEAVMKRRRQQKVEKKLQQCRGQDGQGGTLKIYGESIKPETPYKTLLLSTADNVRYVIRETMDKYGMDFTLNNPDDFCLVQVLVPPGEREYHGGNIGEERIMEDHECPLAIAMDFPPAKGTMMFHFRKRPNDAKKTKHKKLRAVSHEELRSRPEESPMQKLPYLVELNPDGSDNPKGKVHRLSMNYTEVGSDQSMVIKIQGPNIQPCHCILELGQKDGLVTVTPNSPEAETHVNNQRISDTTALQDGMTVRFGKLHVFRFIDPNFNEKLRKGQIPPDGAVQKHRMQHQKSADPSMEGVRPIPAPRESRQQEPMETQRRGMPPQPMGSPRRDENAYPPQRQGGDLLPAILEFREDKEDNFFASIILDSATAGIQFKLAPTYTIYLAVRFSLSSGYRPELNAQEKAMKITNLVIKIANLTHQAIHSHRDNPAALAFWMANSSEILHFFKQDHDIHPFSQDAQEMLAESVQTAFHHLNRCLQYDLQRTLPAFLDENDEDEMNDKSRNMQYNRNRPLLGDVLDTLSSAMNLLRRCRVNAALTIQLFSQLFHFINMWLFNILVKEQHQLCMRVWGIRLKRRLGSVEAWAEKQGLELAADCHLCRIIQAAHLLQARKSSTDDIADITATCFKLNSLQLRELLHRYIPGPDEPPVPQQLIEGVVKIAENMADEQIKSDGREVCLEEDADLQLPFLLPEDGYTCDSIKGIPKGMEEFINPLAETGICRIIPQPGASGDWTVYMTGDEGPRIDEAVRKATPQHQAQTGHHGDRSQQQLPKEPEIATVTFNKVKGSMGLSIVEATPKSEGQKVSGIYIKSVVPGGAAAIDGRLQAGDQLLEVDGKGLVGLSQDKAAELMTRTGQTVTLKVVKQGAFYHGLATLLSQPSPVLPRASPKKPSSPQSNKHRPPEEGPPPYNPAPDMERTRPHHMGMDPRQKQAMQSPHNRSSPALNSDSMTPGGRNFRDHPPHPSHRQPHPRDPRDLDNKSKSMANLHMDNSFDHRDPPHHQHNMRPAASVGALQQPNVPFQEYFNQRPNDPRGNDYENHPSMDPRIPRNQQEAMRNQGYHDVNHNIPPGHMVKPQLRDTMEQGSPSSRHSGSSGREERPQSAYYGGHPPPQPDFGREERPKSMEVNMGKIQEMQQRYGQPQHSPHQSPHERSFDSERDPNYYNMNMRAQQQQQQQQQQMQSGYVNQSDIPRYTANNESRQLNFYENTSPRQNEPSPAFHQIKSPDQAHNEGKRPPPKMPKPSVAPKPNGPKVTPADIPRVDVDNRHTQLHFFDPKIQQQPEQRSPKVLSSQPNYPQGRGMPPHSAGFQHDPRTNSLPRGKFTPPRDSNYHPQTHQSPELPPPPQDIPPELPPPPAPEDIPEELPPLPPPPANDYSLDPQYANSADPRFGSTGGFQQQSRFNQPQQRVLPQQQRNMGYVEPQQQFMQQPPHSATLPNRYQQPNNDYQNIFNEKQNRSFESSMPHPTNQNVYESYDPKSRPPMKADPQVSKHRLISEVSELAHRAQKDGGPLVSPWDREEQEKLNKAREEEMGRLREQEIHELESRPYLSPQEQDRLKKLRLEQEFQRRVQECSNRDDEDEDSDNDITSRTQGREYLIQTIQEDISKAHRKLEELNQKQMYEEFEREKDRMQRLERKLEMYELEREERQQRLQKRQEKKLREQEEYQRKQRELREKQRQEYEEQKRMMMMEEERLMKKKQEEEQKRKEMERERLRELEAQREQEEARLRAEARMRQEEHQRREIEQREKERREQEKRDQELRVREEAQRLEALRLQNNRPLGYNQQYANLPAHSQYGAPAPPVRVSSYDVHVANRQNERNPEIQNGFSNTNNSNFRNVPETVQKKSVSFNTQLETRNTYSVGSESDRTPFASQSSYRSSTSDQNEPHSPYGQPPTPDHAPDNVFDSAAGTPQQNHVSYKTTEITPTVVGAQEVYRDPRSRIMAQKEAQSGNAFSKKPASDRMSFRDKMKFFAQEAGENTPKEKPKASKTLRNIESQLHNGK